MDPTGLTYEDFKREAQINFWDNLISRVENLFSGRGFVTNSELRIRERDRLTEGVKNDLTVASVQAALVMMGYDLGTYGTRNDGVDGSIGRMTRTALREFQQAAGLYPIGEVCPQTMQALDKAVQAGFTKDKMLEVGERYEHFGVDAGNGMRYPVGRDDLVIRGTDAHGSGWYGARRGGGTRPPHSGVDLLGNIGDPAYAVNEGRVIVGYDKLSGNYVRLVDPQGNTMFSYAHLNEVFVKTGDMVRAGQMLGTIGVTGNAYNTRPHLHFGVINRQWEFIDPATIFPAFLHPMSGERTGNYPDLQINP